MQGKNPPGNSLPKSAVGAIAARKRAEEALPAGEQREGRASAPEHITEHQQPEALLRTRLRLSEIAHAASVDDLTQAALDEAEKHTGSRVGYFHFVDADQQHVTLQVWSTNTLKHMCQAEGKGSHYPISQAGVWVDCFHARAPVIHNDYAGLSHKKGLPAGHAPIVRDLGVPVLREGRVAAIMGVGNKESDYTPHDVAVLQDLASWVMDLVSAKQAQAALARVASFPELNPNPIVEVDRAGQVHYVNPAAQRLFPDLEKQGLRHPYLAGCESAVGQATSTVREVVIGGRCYQQTVYCVVAEQRVRLYGMDVTARKRAEEALKKANDELETQVQERTAELDKANAYNRSLLEASPDPLVTIRVDGKITDVNEAAVKVTGVPRKQLIGTDFCNYFTEPEKARAGYQQVFREGSVRDYPLELRRRDGHITSVLYNASVYRDESGKVIGVFAAARDVTAQKQASQYARSLIEAALDPLVTISADGKITDVNEAAVKVTGVPREQLIGTDFSNYFTEPAKAREGYQRVFAEGFVTDYPLTIRHRQGGLTDVLYNASVYKDARGNVLGVFAAARDITERKQAEEALRSRTEELDGFFNLPWICCALPTQTAISGG